MINIELNGKKYEMPSDFDDINIDVLQRVTELEELNIEDEFEKNIKLINILAKIPISEIYELPFNHFQKILSIINFLNINYEKKMQPEFEFNNIKYKINLDFEQMKTKKFFDLDMLQKQGYKQLHMLLAIVYEEENEEYNIQKIKERAEIFKYNMPASYALSTMGFMYVLCQIFVSNSELFSQIAESQKKMAQTLKIEMEMNKKNQDSAFFQKNGVGI